MDGEAAKKVCSESVSNATAEDEVAGLDCEVEDGGICSVDAEVTTSSPEPEENESYLPFQNLALELEEEEGTAGTNTTSQQSVKETNVVESSEDTVLSTDAFPVSEQEEREASAVKPNLLKLSVHATEQSLLSNEDADVTQGEPVLEPGDAMDEDTNCDSNTIQDGTSQGNLNESTKTYLEDLLISSASNSMQDSDSTVNEDGEDKGRQLYRFPKIVKALETVDYETLQIIYRLLYLRNAWDTEEILTQRILEFSGFNCDPSSEDFYTRDVMLHTMQFDIVRKIADVFCLESNAPGKDQEKARIECISTIMKFLSRPSRKPRTQKPVAKKISPKPKQSPSSRKKLQKPQRPTKPSSETAKASKADTTVDVVPSSSACNNSLLSFSESGVAFVKPGPLSYKLKVTGEVEDRILEIERELKAKLKEGKAPQVKIVLNKTDVETHFKKLSDRVKSEGKSKMAVKEEEDDDSSTDVEDMSGEGLIKNEETSEKEKEVEKKKLREFSHVVSSIEGTPEELLAELHMVLFLKKGEMDELKEHILDFSGFTFAEDSQEFKDRVECLNGMKEDVVKNIARALYLDPKSEKDATINHLLAFLKQPSEKLLRPTVIAPGMLSDLDVDIDIEGMSDSDDSITCEVVEKKVECIDLLSSGDESDETKKEAPVEVKKEPLKPQESKVEQQPTTSTVTAAAADTSAAGASKKRTLRDFETITKIVNTHPTEYLVDIYNLLYMKDYEPSTLRKEILDFSSFEFDKTSPEYTKRKQFLDRMLYNSVRRIYNTLIHNTREVKVFSKPTMIGEIFQFLFKLPDTDTSIRPPPVPKVNVTPYAAQAANKAAAQQNQNLNVALTKGMALPSQSGKLSDLKRVFQRVACFPCEYLVDVHKLLFMTDCEMKDIRANIFGFKGFSFGVDSPEFQQRKMYLEYLTFHSLRKISSVLTTKTVDLRNSTKHELANHLTEVLKEYCNTYFETEPIGVPAAVSTDQQQQQQPPPQPSLSQPQLPQPQPVEPATPEIKQAEAVSADAAIEQIVVTPIIEPLHPSPSTTPEPYEDRRNDNMTVSSSSSSIPSSAPIKPAVSKPQTADTTSSKKPAKAEPQVPVVSSPQTLVSSTAVSGKETKDKKPSRPRKRGSLSCSRKVKPAATSEPSVSTSTVDSASNQFADINLPELENYRKLYETKQPIKPAPKPNVPTTIAPQPRPNVQYNFRPEYLLQQVSQPFGPMLPPGVQLPLLHTFPQPIHHIPAPTYVLPQHPVRPKLIAPGPDEEYGAQFFAETVMGEEPEPSPPAKRMKKTPASEKSGAENLRIVESSSLAERKDEFNNPSSSLHLKIRDAMTKASEDEEDCDKPLATLVGHPNDKVLKQQICEIVENTDLQEITINGVIQKIFSMYPKYNLNYRKEFIKSTLRSLLYRLGEQENSKGDNRPGSAASDSPDCSVSTTDPCDSPNLNKSGAEDSLPALSEKSSISITSSSDSPSFQQKQTS